MMQKHLQWMFSSIVFCNVLLTRENFVPKLVECLTPEQCKLIDKKCDDEPTKQEECSSDSWFQSCPDCCKRCVKYLDSEQECALTIELKNYTMPSNRVLGLCQRPNSCEKSKCIDADTGTLCLWVCQWVWFANNNLKLKTSSRKQHHFAGPLFGKTKQKKTLNVQIKG